MELTTLDNSSPKQRNKKIWKSVVAIHNKKMLIFLDKRVEATKWVQSGKRTSHLHENGYKKLQLNKTLTKTVRGVKVQQLLEQAFCDGLSLSPYHIVTINLITLSLHKISIRSISTGHRQKKK